MSQISSSIYSVPGKSFVAGEYLALEGGLTLLACLAPRFQLRVMPGRGLVHGISDGSPAAILRQQNQNIFCDKNLEFIDPHAGAGGLGASTAQYLMVYAAAKSGSGLSEDLDLELSDLLKSYRQDAWDGTGVPPSGADLVAQYRGGWVFYERTTGLLQQTRWPFADLVPVLIRTGEKVPTHEHLRGLTGVDGNELADIMANLKQTWLMEDGPAFCEAIAEYGSLIRGRGWATDRSRELLREVLWQDGVKAAKGCGALGADFVLAIVARDAINGFQRWATDESLQFLMVGDQISGGLEMHLESLPVTEAAQSGVL